MSDLSEYYKARGLKRGEGYDPDDFYMWLSEKRAFDEYVRLRPKRDAEERRWIENRHNSVMNQVSEWVSEKIAGFVVIVGGYASSIHRDLGEAKEIARANRDFHSDVRLKRIRVPDSKI